MKPIGLIKLLRFHYCLPLTAGYGVIVLYLTQGSLDTLPYAWPLAFVSLFCVMAGAYALNDLWDRASDQINHPKRVLITGEVSLRGAGLSAAVLFVLSLLCAIACGVWFLVIMGGVALSLLIYNRWSKQWGLVKAMWVAMMATSLYPLAWALVGSGVGLRVRTLWIHAVWFFLTAMGYEMLKDIRDVKGDAVAGSGVGAAIRTRSWYRILLRTVLMVGAVIVLLPFVLGYCQWVYGVVAACAVVLACVASFAPLKTALACVYIEVALITLGSLADALVFGF
ncbi:MAG: UbiA family prenyltransferase [Phycisphaeraceae bacterium]|nr:UbiA family prenyltransferase [Phycisphaeraceae bacterium]